MPRSRILAKRIKSNSFEPISHADSIDSSSDLAFLMPNEAYPGANIFFRFLITGRITNTSFSELYKRSKQIGWNWQRVFIEERSNLSSDEKTKSKRYTLNRLIEECSKAVEFNQQADILNEQIKKHMSDAILLECIPDVTLENIEMIYAQVEAWRKLQSERHLFVKKRDHLHSLLSLQRTLTDHFVNLMNSQNFEDPRVRNALIRLFDHSLIIVAQPSSPECVAMTKYEKVGKDFLAKIKTRIICLIDPYILQRYVQLSNIDVILYPMNRAIDIEGDKQPSLPWKTRTVISHENIKRTFLYAELTEKDSIQLTKINPGKKPLYNREICQLEFRTKIQLIGTDIERILIRNSKPFGVCSHAKYYPRYLTKVFIEETNEIHPDMTFEFHINALKNYICEFHKRITGVETKLHTQTYIEEELLKVIEPLQQGNASVTAPVMVFFVKKYEELLVKLFIQMKFLSNHPFLSIMYHESLFLGICNETVDDKINHGTVEQPAVLLRFDNKQITEYPEIIFVIYNGRLRRARITHGSFIDDMCRILREAADNIDNQFQLFISNTIIPFQTLRHYYDSELNQFNIIQNEDGTNFYSLKLLLRDTIQTNHGNQSPPIAPSSADHVQSQLLTQIFNSQHNIIQTFTLEGEILGNRNSLEAVKKSLQEHFSQLCNAFNIQGSMNVKSEVFNNNDMSQTESSMSFDDGFNRFFDQNNI